MADKFRMRRTSTQLIDPLVQCAPNDYECNVTAIAIRPLCRKSDGPTQHRLPLPKLDILAVDADEHRLRNGKQRTMSRRDDWIHVRSKLLVKRKYSTCGTWRCTEYATEAESRARTGRNPVGLKWVDTNEGSAEAPRYRLLMVCTEVRHKGVEPIFSATPPLETLRVLLCVACQEGVFRVEDPFLISIADVRSSLLC